MKKTDHVRFDIIVRNGPGELARLAKVLTTEDVNIAEISICSVDGISSIQISAPSDTNLPDKLRRLGHQVIERRRTAEPIAEAPKVVRDLFRSLMRRGLRIDSVIRANAGKKSNTIVTVDLP